MRTEGDVDRSAEPVADMTPVRVDEGDEFAEPVTGTLPVQAADDEVVADAVAGRADEGDLSTEPVADAAPAQVDDVDVATDAMPARADDDLSTEPVADAEPARVDEDEPVTGTLPVQVDEAEPGADEVPERVGEDDPSAESLTGTVLAREDDVELFAEPADTAPERVDDVDLFAEPVADAALETPDGVDLPTGTAPTRPDGEPPRGLTPDGSVRTTGWLQVGDHPVSSALLAALAGLLWALVAAAVLVREFPVAAGVLTLTVPVACGVLWWLLTTWLRPASTARNVETCRAEELEPGDVVRLHGSIGPVGRITEVVVGEDVRVILHGGNERTWAPDQTVHLAELLS
ncbi:hypothetical protein ACSHWB_34005 [Lentzea sp. HUAS TT2]|uniref:hypothetical protein n=1 Tax=Lentzea sp. HUAS TT2 TaxID=3447454 RepID=UPI003F72E45E